MDSMPSCKTFMHCYKWREEPLGGLHGDLENMKNELEHMVGFLKEQLQMGGSRCVQGLSDVAYDVEDILVSFMR
ncbi:hypothetical protein Leryth_020113 [Lithospermum erythrorhizon]|nr:hypothetical protein Leryth_020113 [Lithospermum erythrorhizon]